MSFLFISGGRSTTLSYQIYTLFIKKIFLKKNPQLWL